MGVEIEFYRIELTGHNNEENKSFPDCELTHSILHRLESELFTGREIKLITRLSSGDTKRELPLILINGETFSSGEIPDTVNLIRTIGSILEDKTLIDKAEEYVNFRNPIASIPTESEPVIYYSPTCPHCRALQSYLDENNVSYSGKNIVDNLQEREKLKTINPMMTIPVIVHKGKTYIGFKKEEVDRIFNILYGVQKDISSSDYTGPEIDKSLLAQTVEKAKELLVKNREDGITRASAHLYPHQWSWDAAFIARGLLHYDCEAAYSELKALFKGQWSDGFQPHIVFNNKFIDHFPGPEYWKSEKSGKVPHGVFTSGIGQPPVHSSMILPAIYLDGDKDRAKTELEFLYGKLKAMHDFYFRSRMSKENNLIYLVHPWESGLDNAPLWDQALAGISNETEWSREMQKTYDQLAFKGKRPARSYINKYSYLVESLYSRNYDWEKIGRDHEFRICDVLFNSVLCKSEEDLGSICRFIGKDPSLHTKRSKELRRAINTHLWDEADGIFYDYDLVSHKPIKKDTVFSYIPLAGDICSQKQAERLIAHLKSHCFCIADKDCMGIPSYDMCKIDYEGEFYWRGPIWFNMSWYIFHGLKKYGYGEDSIWLRNSLYKLVMDKGFYEYYKPETGEGLGADGFSWTAALFLDLVSTDRSDDNKPGEV